MSAVYPPVSTSSMPQDAASSASTTCSATHTYVLLQQATPNSCATYDHVAAGSSPVNWEGAFIVANIELTAQLVISEAQARGGARPTTHIKCGQREQLRNNRKLAIKCRLGQRGFPLHVCTQPYPGVTQGGLSTQTPLASKFTYCMRISACSKKHAHHSRISFSCPQQRRPLRIWKRE
jgi:hypothetical protein